MSRHPLWSFESLLCAARRSCQRLASAGRLLFATVALAVGWAAVLASLVPVANTADDFSPLRTSAGGLRALALAMPDQHTVDHLRQPLPSDLAGAAHPAAIPRDPWAVLPRGSVTVQWPSPLDPQHGVTLWHRIRVSDHAFLLEIAMQLHAPATLETPGPRPISSSCCPR